MSSLTQIWILNQLHLLWTKSTETHDTGFETFHQL